LYNAAEKQGLSPATNIALGNEIANFVNIFTGRGRLWGPLEKMAPQMNNLFFSPRLVSARLQTLNPMYYIKADPFVRKQALYSLISTLGAGATMLGLIKQFTGAKVSLNSTSSDYGKIRIGSKLRLDAWGGLQQYVVGGSRVIQGERTDSKGKVTKLGRGFKPISRFSLAEDMAISKLSPVPAFVVKALKQVDYQGKPIKYSKELLNLYTPMVVSDLYEMIKEDPALVPLIVPMMYGVGGQVQK